MDMLFVAVIVLCVIVLFGMVWHSCGELEKAEVEIEALKRTINKLDFNLVQHERLSSRVVSDLTAELAECRKEFNISVSELISALSEIERHKKNLQGYRKNMIIKNKMLREEQVENKKLNQRINLLVLQYEKLKEKSER